MKNQKVVGRYIVVLFFVLSINSCVKKDYFITDNLSKELIEKRKVLFGTNVSHGKTIYYEGGKVTGVSHFKRGKLNGESIVYYKNGQIASRAMYKNDNLWNIDEYYDLNSNVLDYGNLKDGNGLVKIYNRNGRLRSSGNLVDGLKHGEWKYYSNNGLDYVLNFTNGYQKMMGENNSAIL